MRDFNEWLGKMRQSINGYNYYVDFEKVYANVDAIKVAIKSEADGSARLHEKMNALTLYLCLHLAALFVVSSLTKEREHSVIVLFQTLRFGMKNGLRRAVGQKRAKCCDAVQNASFCKVLQAVLGDEAKCLGVYHHVNKKCRNEENKKRDEPHFSLIFLFSQCLIVLLVGLYVLSVSQHASTFCHDDVAYL